MENDVLSVGVIAKRLSVEVNIAKGLLNKLLDEGALKDVRGRRYACLMAAIIALLSFLTKCLCVGPLVSGNKAVLKAHVEAVLIPRFFSSASASPELQVSGIIGLRFCCILIANCFAS